MRLEYAESASGECPRRRDRQCGDVWLCSWLAACDPELADDVCKVEVGFLALKLPVVSSG